ncbi:MAG: hypothetical protein H6671_14985 [Anaerolineaceae bacterium]|nr:hypothetical protein [Anaerolineaceae bacterium]
MQSSSPEHRPTFRHILLAIIAFQFAIGLILWGQVSTPATILGRYSPPYALVLVLWVISTCMWILALPFQERLQTILQALPRWVVIALVIAAVLAITGISASTVDKRAVAFLSSSASCLLAVIVMSRPDGIFPWKHWQRDLTLLFIALLIPLAITITVIRDFSPDEAVWIDRAKTLYLEGNAYARHIFYEPTKIELARGWVIGLYTWLLPITGIDIIVGRMINLAMYLLGLTGIGLVTWKLYDRATAFVSVAFAALGSRFFYSFDYREDHFISVGQTAAFFAAIAARQTEKPLLRYFWHGLCGLFITGSMQIHAATIGFIFGLSLFYLAEFILNTYRQRRVTAASLYTLVAFGVGALIGTGIYWQFNVQPFGLEKFLHNLMNERGESTREFTYLFSGSLFTLLAVWSGLIYLAWRRNQADRLYLGLWICSVIGITLVDTQGYVVPYIALMLVPAGVPLVQGLRHTKIASGLNTHSAGITLSILFPLIIALIIYINWPAVGQAVTTGVWPRNKVMDFAEQVVNHVQPTDDEMVIATHELVWGMPYHLNFYSPLSESIAALQRGWTGTQTWDYLSPDLYIEIPRRIDTPPGLRAYLEREHFLVCDQFDVLGYAVTVYRRECPVSESP